VVEAVDAAPDLQKEPAVVAAAVMEAKVPQQQHLELQTPAVAAVAAVILLTQAVLAALASSSSNTPSPSNLS
jgi:hypothetical protein